MSDTDNLDSNHSHLIDESLENRYNAPETISDSTCNVSIVIPQDGQSYHALVELIHVLSDMRVWSGDNATDQAIKWAQVLGTISKCIGDVDEMPIGSIMLWPTNTAPANYAICNGQELLKATYTDLYAVIGDTFGTPSTSDYFVLPDFTGLIPAGAGNANGLNLTAGQTTGNATTTLTAQQIPELSVALDGTQTPTGSGSPYIEISRDFNSDFSIPVTVGNQNPSAVSLVQPTIGIYFVIRAL